MVIVRDIRDTLASQYDRCLKSNIKFNLNQEIDFYLRSYISLSDIGKKDQAFLKYLYYENLVSDTASVMSDIAGFLNIKFDDNGDFKTWKVKRLQGQDSSTVLDGKSVSDVNVGKYRDRLPQKYLQFIENNRQKIQDVCPTINMFAL